MKKRLPALAIVVSVVFLPIAAHRAAAADFDDPSALVTGIYGQVSRTADHKPDWELIRGNFHPEAVVVLRVARDETRLMSLDGFIADFVGFYNRIGADAMFTEEVISSECLVYGNVARCSVVYEAAVAESERGPQRGLDLWHLMKSDGRWWVVSVVNESEVAAGPIPEDAVRR